MNKDIEQTKRELLEKWGYQYAEEGWKLADVRGELNSDLTALLDKQREVILREELIKYEMWRNTRCSDDEATCIINGYLKNVKK